MGSMYHHSDLPQLSLTARQKQQEAGIASIKNKGRAPVPEIDFSLYTQDDGSVVSTQERVVKDVQAPALHKPTDDQFFSHVDPSKPSAPSPPPRAPIPPSLPG